MSGILVFFIEPTKGFRRWLRRYQSGDCSVSGQRFHNARFKLDDARSDVLQTFRDLKSAMAFDARWPTHCSCGYEFGDNGACQLFVERIYRRTDTGEEMTLREAPAGACWNAYWVADGLKAPTFNLGDDGRCLVVKTPGGEWVIDSRASNCTLPDDSVHKCWVRHGRPEDGSLHVDKNGLTCGAGAGSIQCGDYHGFLHNGYLVP